MLKKIIVKTALTTVIGILVIILATVAIINFAFPGLMADYSESVGNYELAVRYAVRCYETDPNDQTLCRVVEDSIRANKEQFVVKYGQTLLDLENFDQICQQKDEQSSQSSFGAFAYAYRQYIYGYVAVANYHQNEKEKAVNLALEGNGTQSFVRNNAIVILSLTVIKENDSDTASTVLARVATITCEDSTQQNYLTTVKNELEKVVNK